MGRLGTLCGVGLSAGGFAIAAAVYLLGLERYRPILRTSVLISFLGYCTVCAGMMYELGIAVENLASHRDVEPALGAVRSVVVRDALHHGAGARVLARAGREDSVGPAARALSALAPQHSDRPGAGRHPALVHAPVVSRRTLSDHQRQLDPLWYTPYLTTMFYLSAIPAGLAVTIMAIYLCVRSLNARVDMSILSDVSRVIAPLLAMYGIFRGSRSDQPRALHYLWMWREETLLFWLEIALLVVIPLILLNRRRCARTRNTYTGPAPWS